MPNIIAVFKNYLKLLSPEEQLIEIEHMIDVGEKSINKCRSENISRKFSILKKLRTLKKKIMINHEEYSH